MLNRADKNKYFNKVDEGQVRPLRFVLSASGFLYKILMTSVQHKAETQSDLAVFHSKPCFSKTKWSFPGLMHVFVLPAQKWRYAHTSTQCGPIFLRALATTTATPSKQWIYILPAKFATVKISLYANGSKNVFRPNMPQWQRSIPNGVTKIKPSSFAFLGLPKT